MGRLSGRFERRLAPASLSLSIALLAPVAGCSAPPLVQVSPPPDLPLLEAQVLDQYLHRRALVDALDSGQAAAAARGDAWGRLGQWFHVYGYLERAEASYRNARVLEPEEPSWRYYLADVLRRQGANSEARNELLGVLALRPRELPAMVLLAEIELTEGRWDAADYLFSRALDQVPGLLRAELGLAHLALLRQDPAEAVARLERAAETHPEASALHHALGLAYRGLGELDRATVHLERGLGNPASGVQQPALEDPWMAELRSLDRSSQGHQRRGRRALTEGRPEEALKHFEQAVLAAPEHPGPRLNLAIACLRAGRPDRAVESLEALLGIDPDHAQAHYHLALALERQGRSSQAQESFRRAVELDPRLAGSRSFEDEG